MGGGGGLLPKVLLLQFVKNVWYRQNGGVVFFFAKRERERVWRRGFAPFGTVVEMDTCT